MQKNNQKIPEGWSVKKLRDIATFCGGSTPPRVHPEYFGGDVPWVKTTDLNNSVLYKTEENLTLLGLNASACKIIQKGAVCVAMYGGFNQIGRTCLLGVDAAINQALTAIIPNKNLFNHFLLLYLNNNVRSWRSYAGSSRKDPNITKKDIESFKINLPPFAEQEKIAEILGTWDEAIEKLSGLIEQKKLLKKGLMQKLLTGKTRLSGFTQPWKEVKLGEMGHITSAGVDKNIVPGEQNVILLNYMDIYKKDFIYKDDIKQIVTAPDRKIKNCNVLMGDVFFTPSSETRDDIGHSAVIMENIPGAVYSYHIVRFRPLLNHLNRKFCAYAFKTSKFYKQAYSLCEGSGQRYVLSQDDFRNMKVYIPSDISEQQAIADVLSTADDEINLLNQKIEALKEQKKGLMQQLLTGQIRVKMN